MTQKRTTNSSKPLGLSRISQAFIEHNTFLKKFLKRFLQREQDIEDVVQEAYLKAYSIAKNLAINELTRKSRQMTGYIEECHIPLQLEISDSVESEVEGQESLGIYCEAVAALPEKCRRVYLLRKVHGLPHKDIAERLGVSLSTVEKHLRLGTLSCRDYIRRHNEQQPWGSLPRVAAKVVPLEGTQP